MHYLLIYSLSPDYLERRKEFRNEHLSLAWQAYENEELELGGALTDPTDEAFLLFRGDSPEIAERFAKQDPYVKNGLVKSWKVRGWNTVVGNNSAFPTKPE